jgi:hypothetical protein
LDRSILLDLGTAIFLVLFNKVLSVSPREAKSKLVQDPLIISSISNGKFIFFCFLFIYFYVNTDSHKNHHLHCTIIIMAVMTV